MLLLLWPSISPRLLRLVSFSLSCPHSIPSLPAIASPHHNSTQTTLLFLPTLIFSSRFPHAPTFQIQIKPFFFFNLDPCSHSSLFFVNQWMCLPRWPDIWHPPRMQLTFHLWPSSLTTSFFKAQTLFWIWIWIWILYKCLKANSFSLDACCLYLLSLYCPVIGW